MVFMKKKSGYDGTYKTSVHIHVMDGSFRGGPAGTVPPYPKMIGATTL
jgi:hypothetical protein